MALPKTQAEWGERLTALLKSRLKQSEVTYSELVKRLKRYGFKESEASITMKLKRGTFSAAFMLAVLSALESEGLRLEDL